MDARAEGVRRRSPPRAVIAFGLYTATKAAYLSTKFATVVAERNLIYLAPLAFVATALALRARPPAAGGRWPARAGFVLYVILTTPYQLNLRPYSDALGLSIVQMANRRPRLRRPRRHVAARRRPRRLGRACCVAPRFARHAGGSALLIAADRGGARARVEPRRRDLGEQRRPTASRRRCARTSRARRTGSTRRRVRTPTIYLGQRIPTTPNGIWLMEFWNRSLRYVWSLDGTRTGAGDVPARLRDARRRPGRPAHRPLDPDRRAARRRTTSSPTTGSTSPDRSSSGRSIRHVFTQGPVRLPDPPGGRRAGAVASAADRPAAAPAQHADGSRAGRLDDGRRRTRRRACPPSARTTSSRPRAASPASSRSASRAAPGTYARRAKMTIAAGRLVRGPDKQPATGPGDDRPPPGRAQRRQDEGLHGPGLPADPGGGPDLADLLARRQRRLRPAPPRRADLLRVQRQTRRTRYVNR